MPSQTADGVDRCNLITEATGRRLMGVCVVSHEMKSPTVLVAVDRVAALGADQCQTRTLKSATTIL